MDDRPENFEDILLRFPSLKKISSIHPPLRSAVRVVPKRAAVFCCVLPAFTGVQHSYAAPPATEARLDVPFRSYQPPGFHMVFALRLSVNRARNSNCAAYLVSSCAVLCLSLPCDTTLPALQPACACNRPLPSLSEALLANAVGRCPEDALQAVAGAPQGRPARVATCWKEGGGHVYPQPLQRGAPELRPRRECCWTSVKPCHCFVCARGSTEGKNALHAVSRLVLISLCSLACVDTRPMIRLLLRAHFRGGHVRCLMYYYTPFCHDRRGCLLVLQNPNLLLVLLYELLPEWCCHVL